MLEKYIEDFDGNKFVRDFAKKHDLTLTQARTFIEKRIPKENYYQTAIKEAITKRFPGAFVAKIAQGPYSYGGIPDLMVIYKGLYFGFEVKRPLLGEVSRIQLQTIAKIQKAGGTAAVVRWPEEAIAIIEQREGKAG